MTYDDGYKTFANEVQVKIREWLPEQLKDADISLQTIWKNNGVTLKSLVIREHCSNVAPNIYLEGFYEEYLNGSSMERVMQDIVRLRMSQAAEAPINVETSFLTDFDKCRDLILPRLIGTENNKELLKNRPHVMIADLAVTFCVDLGEIKGGSASIPIHNGLAMSWGMTSEELYQIAIDNLEKTEGVFLTMPEILFGLIPEDAKEIFECESAGEMKQMESMMFVLTNKSMNQGASMILNKRMTSQIISEIGDGFLVIPSSLHETIILPSYETMSKEDINRMIQEVNATQVSQEEILSSHAYRYTLQDGLTVM